MRRLVLVEPVRLLREGIAGLLRNCGYEVIERTGLGSPDQYQTADDSVDLILTEISGANCGMATWLERLQPLYPSAKIVILTDHANDASMIESALLHGAMGYVEKNMSAQAISAIIDAVLHGQMAFPRQLRDRMIATISTAKNRREETPLARLATVAPTIEPASHLQIAASDGKPPSDVPRNHQLRPAARSLSPEVSDPPQADLEPEANLSTREEEILCLITSGHANKVIARKLEISEATVKSHVKSLLRKIRVTNRTQAAIWAVGRSEQGRIQQPTGTNC